MSDFSIHNIPFGVASAAGSSVKSIVSAFETSCINLAKINFPGPLLGNGVAARVFGTATLNAFMALGRPAWREARLHLQSLIKSGSLPAEALFPMASATMHLPVEIGGLLSFDSADYTDFYASKEHATNVGTMFRGKDNALMPNWTRLPVGYHGRASSVVVSGTPIKRPSGLILDPTTKEPYYSISKKLDFELEVAFLVGVGNTLGSPIPISETEDHIFGMVLMNDWSSRDIQQFEYVPLGPFLGKNFGTTISPWVVTLDALELFRTPQPVQDPAPSEYLTSNTTQDAYDVALQVLYKTENSQAENLIATSNLKYMYWSFKQQLAHHTVNGCNTRTGDLMGSGTISGPNENEFGSMLELSWNGTKQVDVGGGESRSFIQDGDSIIIRGYCQRGDVRIGFGDCAGKVIA